MIVIGLIGALAAVVGVLDLLTIPAGTRAQRTALVHLAINVTVVVAYVVNLVWHYRGYDHPRAVGAGPVRLSVLSVAALGVSGFLGGTLAYHYGVRVAAESDQAAGF